MPQNFLRGPLIDAVEDAQRLPRLAEAVEVNHAAERVFVRDAGALEVGAQRLVIGERMPEHATIRHHVFRADTAQLVRQRGMQRHGALFLVLRRRVAKQRVRVHFVQVNVSPHERVNLALPLARVEQHQVSNPAVVGDGEEAGHFLFRERPGTADLLAADVDHVDLGERIPGQLLRLHEPVEECVNRNLILFLRLCRATELAEGFNEGVRPHVGKANPARASDEPADPVERVVHMPRSQFAASQIGTVGVHQLAEGEGSGPAHGRRRNDAFRLALLFNDDVTEPLSGHLFIRGVKGNGDDGGA